MDGQEIFRQLLPDPENWQVEGVRLEPETSNLTIELRVRYRSSQCPSCQQPSQRVHSWYCRTVVDVPMGEWSVKLRLHVRRLRCGNADCAQQVFTERLPQVVAPSARRTKRVAQRQQTMTLLVSSSIGARLSALVGMPGGKDTLLRLVRRVKLPLAPTPRVLGVDDWAKRRGHSYGTLLVDLETHRVVDVLPDREAASFAQWLKTHPGVEIISRDRAECYAEGAAQGAPQAQQVADRWHLLKNLGEALVKVLEQHTSALRGLSTARSADPPQPSSAELEPVVPTALPSPSPGEQQQQERRAQRLARYEQVRDDYRRGKSVSAIARQMSLDRKTVRKFIQAKAFPERQARAVTRRFRRLDPYIPYLTKRWQEGCCNVRQLWREVQAQGFTGSLSVVAQFLADWRRAQGLPPRTRLFSVQGVLQPVLTARPLSPRRAAWLVLSRPEDLQPPDLELMDRLQHLHPDLQAAVTLAQDFATMLRQRTGHWLETWLDRAASSALPPLVSFVTGIRRDFAAVQAGLSMPWSNGQTEAQVNRLKFLKRQMFGRANFDLLRIRVLCTAFTLCTKSA